MGWLSAGNSSSSSKTVNKTTNTDNRVVADGEAIALGNSSTYNNNVPEGLFDLLGTMTSGVISLGTSVSDKAAQTVGEAVESNEAALKYSVQGESSSMTDIMPWVAGIGIAGALAWGAGQVAKNIGNK